MKIENKKTLNIPVDLIEHCLKEKHIPPLRLFTYLKSICSGYFDFSGPLKEECCSDLKISTRTFESHFRWLLRNRWVTVNRKKKHIGWSDLSNCTNGMIYIKHVVCCSYLKISQHLGPFAMESLFHTT